MEEAFSNREQLKEDLKGGRLILLNNLELLFKHLGFFRKVKLVPIDLPILIKEKVTRKLLVIEKEPE